MDKQQLEQMVAQTVESLGYQLWGMVYQPQGGRYVLRVYIDKDQGINVDDCQQVARQLSAMLDVEDGLQARYNLEVSSPGINRPLLKPAHFAHFTGSMVKLKMAMPVQGRRHFKGCLKHVTDDAIILTVEEDDYELKLANVKQANLLGIL